MERREFIIAGGLILAGCANPGLVRQNESNCCHNLSEAKYIDYQLNSLIEVSIDKNSPSYSFSSGESRFISFRLPAPAGPNAVLETLASYSGFWLPLATVFVPKFMFLDASFNELSSIEPELYEKTARLYDGGLVDRYFYGACFVPEGTAYVVVYTDASAIGKKTVQCLGTDSASGSAYFERAREVYKKLDKRDFASGRVRHIPDDHFARFDISRVPDGEIRLLIGAE